MTPPEPQTPTTEAGRAMLEAMYPPLASQEARDAVAELYDHDLAAIVRIEAEAAAAERRRMLAEVRERIDDESPCQCDPAYKDRGLEAPDCQTHDFHRLLDDLAKVDQRHRSIGLRNALKSAYLDGLIGLPDDECHRWCDGSGGDDHSFDSEWWLDDLAAAVAAGAASEQR